MKDQTSDVAVAFQNDYSETPAASPAPSAPVYIDGVGFDKTFEENIYNDGVDNEGLKNDIPPLPPPRVQSEPVNTQFARVSQEPKVVNSSKPWRMISGRWTIAGFAVMFIMLIILAAVTIVSLTTIFKLEDELSSQKNMLQAITTDFNEAIHRQMNLYAKAFLAKVFVQRWTRACALIGGSVDLAPFANGDISDFSANLIRIPKLWVATPNEAGVTRCGRKQVMGSLRYGKGCSKNIGVLDIAKLANTHSTDVLKRLPPYDCQRAIYKLEARRVFLPENDNGITVYCDGITDGGGWLIFQRRFRNGISFDQTWDAYVNGFGTVDTDYWLGLRTLQELTSQQEYELRIHLVDWCGKEKYAHYSFFRVENSDDDYRLRISGYQGNMTDSLSSSNGRRFALPDTDSFSCAHNEYGGWWYSSSCSESNLNGEYIRSYSYYSYTPCYEYQSSSRDPMFWNGFYESAPYNAAIRTSIMMIRPKRD